MITACDQSATKELSLHGATMGTSYTVKAHGLSPKHHSPDIAAETESILLAVNSAMSTYKPDSELSLFNRKQVSQWVEVSSDLFVVLELAQQVSEATKGKFDVTVGPLVNLWGFGPRQNNGAPSAVPSSQAIKNGLLKVGFSKLMLDAQSRSIRKTASIAVDLSAIAKGHAVDLVAEYLESLGLEHYLVEIGGEVRASGTKAGGEPWRIAIEAPNGLARSIQRIINVNSVGVATSGDYRNYYELDGKRYSHTIDPNSGRPVQHSLASVTVMHPKAALADAYATAFLVMGLKAAQDLSIQLNIPAFFILHEQDGHYKEVMTAGFDEYVDR